MIKHLVFLTLLLLFSNPGIAQTKTLPVKNISDDYCFNNTPPPENVTVYLTELCLASIDNTLVDGNTVEFIRVKYNTGAVEIYLSLGFYPDQNKSMQTGGNVLRSAVVSYNKETASLSYVYMVYKNNSFNSESKIFMLEGVLPNGMSFRTKTKQ